MYAMAMQITLTPILHLMLQVKCLSYFYKKNYFIIFYLLVIWESSCARILVEVTIYRNFYENTSPDIGLNPGLHHKNKIVKKFSNINLIW